MRTKTTSNYFCLVLLVLTISAPLAAQSPEKSPAGAMLRSMIMPGWGHYYATPEQWNRGKMYMAADVILISSWVGYTANANRLHDSMITLARTHGGVDLSGRGRQFRLNVGDFTSVDAFNDYQERTRNWDRLYTDTQANHWNWSTEAKRRDFLSMNSRIEQNRQQVPAIISLMIVNRLVSGIGAFTKVRTTNLSDAALTFTIPHHTSGYGVQANLMISF